MKAFFSDLDHTLIYSHRTPMDGPKVLVEMLHEKAQSYMTGFSFSFLRDADWLCLIPVTTRSQAQYERLTFPEAFRVKYTLVCNGGKLLIDGREDREWTETTLREAEDDLPDLERLSERLRELSQQEVRRPEPYYHYIKAEMPEEICHTLRSEYEKDNLLIEHDHSKVYLFPRKINKGEAVRRFSQRYGITFSAGAGDSSMDLPLLNEVDRPLAASPVYREVHSSQARELTGNIISDQICRELERLHARGFL